MAGWDTTLNLFVARLLNSSAAACTSGRKDAVADRSTESAVFPEQRDTQILKFSVEPARELLFGKIERGRAVTARSRSDLKNVFIAPLGNDVGRGDRLPMDHALPLCLRADGDSEWRGVCAGDQLDAVLTDDPLSLTFPGAGIGRVTTDEGDFVAFDAAFFIDHVPGDFHRHVRLVAVLRPWSSERLQDSNLDVLGQCRSEWEAGETSCEHEPRASAQKSLQLPCH